jgi:PPK2 family polyphosphate:nucleotide phosphotransferase
MATIRLSKLSTRAPKGFEKESTLKKLNELTKKIGDLQHALYAEKKQSLLVVFQGLDASGKDGATRNVFLKCGTIGIDAWGFKKPTEEEFAHDFLWRVHKLAPQKGYIQIFNRSHYEDILIQRVHKWIDTKRVKNRMDAINAFEQLLVFDNNTTVLKFYMHISKDKQREKLQERIDDPKSNWKHNSGDWLESNHWAAYRQAYEYAINNSVIPWHIVPVDQKWYRNYAIAQIVHDTLVKMNPQLPVLSLEEKAKMVEIQINTKP